jgi:outer membrane receptor protein involved in Fe transport
MSRILLGALALVSFHAQLASAQSPLIRGRVVHVESGVPIPDALVRGDAGGAMPVRTADDGRFALRVALPGRVIISRIGFSSETLQVTSPAAPIAARLRPVALAIDPSVVRAERTYTTSTSFTLRQLDIEMRPRESSQELLRLVPGLVIAQHAGGGKAEQIFLRGFDADHGTDVAIAVDGVPVNMVSHAHGQGYADLHFLMPEVVERVDVRKGPFEASDGDFATAGAVGIVTRDRISAPSLRARGGGFGASQAVGLLPLGSADGAGGYVAGSFNRARGPFDQPQDYRRLNGFMKWTAPLPAAQFFAGASAFDSRWDASGQVPERAVASGQIGRFGAIDPTEGGVTSRHDVHVGLRSRGDAEQRWSALAYATRYRLDLHSNFTFFLDDPVNGDGIQQVDDRTVAGAQAEVSRALRLGRRDGTFRWGAQLRHDDATVGLFRQRDRERIGVRSDARVHELHAGTWVSQATMLTPQLRAELGARADIFTFAVADRSAGEAPVGGPSRALGVLSPKLNLAYDLPLGVTAFGSAGIGFHSNDARDVVASRPGTTVLPRARSVEVGARRTWARGTASVSAWQLDLESELVWSGDGGATEPSGRTRRVGVDAEARLQVLEWLWLQGDASIARGRFVDEPSGADRIPLAPQLVLTGALVGQEVAGLDWSLRARHVDDRAANEDATVTARGHTIVEAHAGYRFGDLRLVVAVDNLFNATWNEAQFATTSRLAGEPGPVTELHFTPGAPRAVHAGVEFRF